MIEILGWCSAFVLVVTLIVQIRKQWKDATSEGISKWLFIGQLAASIGFTIFSITTHSWVFAVTNSALTVANLVGLSFYFYFKR